MQKWINYVEVLGIILYGMSWSGLAISQMPIQTPSEIQQPTGTWQVPGEIQQPKGPWQKPGKMQVPKGIQAIKSQDTKCQKSLTIGADTLFAFNQWQLAADAEETLKALGPLIIQTGQYPAIVIGHTDAIGSAQYNQTLSEKRAQTVKDWLVAHQYLPSTTPIQGYGETRPIAPNTNADGSDNPVGRQLNRRVEVIIDTCQ